MLQFIIYFTEPLNSLLYPHIVILITIFKAKGKKKISTILQRRSISNKNYEQMYSFRQQQILSLAAA